MPLPANGGRKCPGMNSESRKCNTSPCPGNQTITLLNKSDFKRMMNATRTTAVKRSWKIKVKRWKLKRAQFLLEKRGNEGFIKAMNIISLSNQMKKNFDHLNTNPNCPPPPPRPRPYSQESTTYIAITFCTILNLFLLADGGWTSWGNWSKCSVTCGGGTQRRNRSCTNPPVAYGGKPCEGLTEMSRNCNKHVFCPGNELQAKISDCDSLKSFL